MTKLLSAVYWTANNDPDLTTQQTLLSDITKISIKQSIKPQSNYAEFTLKNPVDRYLDDGFLVNLHVKDTKELEFKEGDTLKVYAARIDENRTIDVSDTSNDLIMSCTLEEIKCKGSDKESTITLKTVDKTFSMLNKLWTFNYPDNSTWTAPLIVQDVIQKNCQFSDDSYKFDTNGVPRINGIYDIDARLKSTGTTTYPAFIEDTRPDTSPFPVKGMAKVFKSAYEFIQDASTPEMTNSSTAVSADVWTIDRNMLFYIDEKNRFHWFYPKDTVDSTLSSTINASVTTVPLTNATSFPSDGRIMIDRELIDYTGTTPTTLTGCTRGVNGTIAVAHSAGAIVTSGITIKEGNTINGMELLGLDMTKKTFDIVNMVIYNAGKDLYGSGILWYYYNINTKEKDLKMTYKPYLDIATSIITNEIDAGNLITSSTGLFTFQEAKYKATAYPLTTVWGDIVSTDSEYNKELRNYAAFDDNSLGAQYSNRFTLKRGNPRWKGTLSMAGFRFRPGDSVILSTNRFGIRNQQLRVNEVTHNITKNMWSTDIEVEEDEEKL